MRSVWGGVALGLVVALPCHAGELDALRDQLDVARQIAKAHVQEWNTVPDGTDAARSAVAREWSLAGQIVATDLEEGGAIGGDTATKDLGLSVVRLGQNAWLISADVDDLGTIFIVQRSNGSFAVAWSINDGVTPDTLTRYPLLNAWTVAGATETCRSRNADECGPMTGTIGRLPDDDSGHTRFYVDGYYSAQQGSDVGYQLSIWTWDGTTAAANLVGFYGQTLEIDPGLRVRSPFLTLKTKEGFQTFFVTAPEPGRQSVWTILMTGDGVRDLGRKSAVPELDSVDDLVARILKDEHSGDLATPKVRQTLVDAMEQSGTAVGLGAKADVVGGVGELWDSEVTHVNHKTFLCFAADGVGFIRFRMRFSGGRYFIADAKTLGDMDSKEDPCTHRKF